MSWFKRKDAQAEAPTPAAAVLGAIEIRRPWARASAEIDDLAAAFLSVSNTGPEGDRLLGAECPVSLSAELRAIKVVGANIEMRPMDNGLALPAGESRELKPRGYHVLLRGMRLPLEPGSRLALTLRFEKAGSLEIGCIVEAPGPVGEAALDLARQ
jgi:copper(I)-binding protein